MYPPHVSVLARELSRPLVFATGSRTLYVFVSVAPVRYERMCELLRDVGEWEMPTPTSVHVWD